MLEASERANHDGHPLIHASYGGAMSLNDAVHCQQQQTVDAGRPHPLLAGRTQADGAFSLAMRPAENVPVYVMLPLDTVSTPFTGAPNLQTATGALLESAVS